MVVDIKSCAEGAEKAEGIVVMIDVFRASNTIIACLACGAKIIPVKNLEEAYRLKNENPDYLLYGEREGYPPEKFDAGNSPIQAISAPLKGKKIIFTSSNGSRCLLSTMKAKQVLIGSFANSKALTEYIKIKNPKKVTLVPVGTIDMQPALEDEKCAEYIKSLLVNRTIDFRTIKKEILASKSADDLVLRGQGVDLEFALQLNIYDIIPEFDTGKKIITHISKQSSFYYLSADEIRAFEDYACNNFNLTSAGMMKKAAQGLFDLVTEKIKPKHILVIAGKGNNGGDAIAAAGLFYENGIKVSLLSPYPDHKMSMLTQAEMSKVKNLQISVFHNLDNFKEKEFDLIIDGLFGFSLSGNPHPPADRIIEWINNSKIPVLSVDVPSGLEAKTGRVMNPTVKADYTLTFGIPKIGLMENKEYVGRLYLGNIGIPEKAYRELGYYSPIFLGKSYISLD